MTAAPDAGAAFFVFFSELVAEGTANKGLAEALAGAGFDRNAVSSGPDSNVMAGMSDLLVRAQRAGAVRGDVDIDDIKALVTGCLARDAPARDRMVSIARAGLQPVP
jgi:hypothetical protein